MEQRDLVDDEVLECADQHLAVAGMGVSAVSGALVASLARGELVEVMALLGVALFFTALGWWARGIVVK
ncbi:hypothetical protein ASE36_21460 [Rhizobium sp. Root274]|uniref:hypothetical protein n=1 Tax=unclassified Rhizobium TaxID=2613769 RepID=UPI0007131FC0|nr:MULTISPECIES: hypothetical protein [unclassified Rhizobium]KQW24231.1 hypothetical protein ASC71_21520 [Rhizobium sp. Root1240]KRD25422.1 hypothetical protein ASE36_21460 [Rhizobium sp. Root274]